MRYVGGFFLFLCLLGVANSRVIRRTEFTIDVGYGDASAKTVEVEVGDDEISLADLTKGFVPDEMNVGGVGVENFGAITHLLSYPGIPDMREKHIRVGVDNEGALVFIQWFEGNFLHRDGGPAVILFGKDKQIIGEIWMTDGGEVNGPDGFSHWFLEEDGSRTELSRLNYTLFDEYQLHRRTKDVTYLSSVGADGYVTVQQWTDGELIGQSRLSRGGMGLLALAFDLRLVQGLVSHWPRDFLIDDDIVLFLFSPNPLPEQKNKTYVSQRLEL